MRISLIIIIVTFVCSKTSSQDLSKALWMDYPNIDSIGNIVGSPNYITEKEIKKMFYVYNFHIENMSIENMSLLPMQTLLKDKINLKRVPFYAEYLPEDMCELYFIGKIAIKDPQLSHYIFCSVVNKTFNKYFLFNYYQGQIASVIEVCSNTFNIDFPELSYRLNSNFIFPNREIILKYDYYDFQMFNETKKVSISDNGLIRIIEIIRN